jgi:hypothetical protein
VYRPYQKEAEVWWSQAEHMIWIYLKHTREESSSGVPGLNLIVKACVTEIPLAYDENYVGVKNIERVNTSRLLTTYYLSSVRFS